MDPSLEKFFIPYSDEQAYCKEHHLSYDTLDNGIKILSAAQQNPESIYTSINFSFSSGSYFDPPGKKGVHHLTEHLINYPLWDKARLYDVQLNATTSSLELKELCAGPSSLKVQQYGIVPLLPFIYKRLCNPLESVVDKEQIINTEKGIIKTEIIHHKADHNWQVLFLFNQLVYKKTNPYTSITAGTEKTLETITLTDVEELIENIFIPKNLTISIVNEGEKILGKNIISTIKRHFKLFPRSSRPRQKINWPLIDHLNEELHAGGLYTRSTHLKNNLLSILLCWPLEAPEFSLSQLALNRVSSEISERVFKISRQKGWGYSAGARLFSGDRKRFFTIRVDLSKRSLPHYDKFIQEMTKHLPLFLKLKQNEIELIIDTEQKRQKALPLQSSARLDWMLFGLKRHNQLVNADKVKARYAQISTRHLEYWLNYFLTHKPIVMVIGDL